MSKVYLFGNGFDLNLELKSRYSDYANSKYWPFKKEKTSRLGDFLNHKLDIETWFDLESSLGSYAQMVSRKEITKELLEQDYEDYQKILTSFDEYITWQQDVVVPKKQCEAADIIRHFATDNSEPIIYTFNYTDLNYLAKDITAYNKFEYQHVHGDSKNHSIILGFGDTTLNIDPKYNFMRKSFNPKYNPPKVISHLLKAETVVFFGLSMGGIDYSYYDYFFRMISSPENSFGTPPKKVIIFAYNNDARMSILNNLFEKTQGNLSNLKALNDFQMVTLKDDDPERVSAIINSI